MRYRNNEQYDFSCGDAMIIETDFYKLTAYHNLIHLESYLSWDERVINRVMGDMAQMVRLFNGENWAVLNNSENWELHTHDAAKHARERVEKDVPPGQTHNAVVVGPSEIKRWQSKQIFEQITRFETRFFNTTKEAEAWLASFGYTLTPMP